MKQYLCLVFAIRSCFSLSHAHTCLQLLSGCSSAVFSLRCTLLVSNSSSSVCCWHHLAPSLQSSSSCFLCMCESLYTTQELLNASNCSCNNLGVEDMSWIISICRCKLSPPTLRKHRGEKEVGSFGGADPLRLGACVLLIGEEHMKMANAVLLVKNNSLLSLTCSLTTNYLLYFIFLCCFFLHEFAQWLLWTWANVWYSEHPVSRSSKV